MLVKSTDVPDAETDVPLTNGYSVPVLLATVPVAVTLFANVVFRPVLIEIASEPPTWMAPEPSTLPFSPMLMMVYS
jgi:hypothetical protein